MQRREFQLVEGSSSKFWAVFTEGADLTVHYGRIGTNGQAQKKTFADAAAAEREANKLIAEKTRKGYAEVSAGHATPTPVAVERKKPAPPPPAPIGEAPQPTPVVAPPALSSTAAQAEPAGGAPAPSIAPASVSVQVRREFQVDPRFVYLRTWEQHDPLPRAESPPFVLADGLERLRSMGQELGWNNAWDKARIPTWPSPEEAQFWLLASSMLLRAYISVPDDSPGGRGVRDFKSPGRLADFLAASYPQKINWPRVSRTALERHYGDERLLLCYLRLTPLEELLEREWPDHEVAGVAAAIRTHILPYLPVDERARLAAQLRGQVRAPVARLYYPPAWPLVTFLQAALGLHQEVAASLAQLPNGAMPASYDSSTQWVALGLGSPAAIRAEYQRLQLLLNSRSLGRAWLAIMGLEGVEDLAASAVRLEHRETAEKVAKTLQQVHAPEAAGPALWISRDSRAKAIGHAWLQEHPVEAAVGLAQLASSGGSLAGAARQYLELQHAGGQLPAVLAEHLTPEAAHWFEGFLSEMTASASLPELSTDELPEVLRAALAGVTKPKPNFLPIGALPPVRVGSGRLGSEHIVVILHELRGTPLGGASAVLGALRQVAEPHSLDRFAWKCFELWEQLGAPAKEKWALLAVGHLGGDQSVLQLTPRVRAWPGESQHQRAVSGLQCLRAIGSDTALMALNGIAQKLKFKALKEKAQELMEEIAAGRGLTREQLADRVVPDCDLDARGSRTFDFGPRQFTFVLGPELKPLVREASGKLRPDLPAPTKADDPAKAEAAIAEWKILKKTLREVLKVQADRLEDAMISGRRWTAEEFRTLLVGHPLMINLTRQLVFAAYENGDPVQTFRVTEDQSLADANDETVSAPATDSIGLVHPAHLDAPTLEAWGQILSDYEIIPPFQQLSRTICQPARDDLGRTALVRFKGPKIPGIVLYGMLERSLWSRDTPADAGGFAQHSKYFPAANCTAFIAYTGLAIGYYEEPQQIEEVYFVPGHVRPDWWGVHQNRLQIGDVDGVVLSEVLRLVHALVSKAV